MTTRTTLRGGPAWSGVVARISSDADSGEVLLAEKIGDISRCLEHARLSNGPVNLQTTFVYLLEDGKIGDHYSTL